MIHQYKLGGYNIVLDVCSGAVHVVDEVAYDIIGMFEENDRDAVLAAMAQKYAELSLEEIAECYAQVVSLKDAGKLFAPDTFEPMAGKLKEKTAGVVKALCLHVAHTCNLNCSYCFASQGTGIVVDMDEVFSYREKGTPIHTMHLSYAIAKKLRITSDEAYKRYLKKGAPAYSPLGRCTPYEAVECIKACGGFALGKTFKQSEFGFQCCRLHCWA